MPASEPVTFTDAIRGAVTIDTAVLDDKVLMKTACRPTTWPTWWTTISWSQPRHPR